MESINLNLIPTGANPVVHVSQYDTGRVIRFNIFEGSSVYFLDGTETISCNIKKPDNNIVTLSVTNTNDSYVEITTTEQATACDGSNLCEISITKGDDVIGSLNFIMEVERSPIEGGISSASEINNLWTQVDGMVADILADSYDSANVIFDNEPTAGHGIPYTVTSEGIGIAIDNALDMTDTASGAIATFESEYALPLRDLEIEINAVQESGTPTPSSPKAISGFTGANIQRCNNAFASLWDIDSSFKGSVEFNQLSKTITSTTNNGVTFTQNADGSITVTGSITEGQTRAFVNVNYTANVNLLIPNHIYFVFGVNDTVRMQGYRTGSYLFTRANDSVIQVQEFTDTASWIRIETEASGTINTTVTPMFIDLTQMFGSTIANYFLGLTRLEAVALFKSLYPNDYYAYDSGTSELVGDTIVNVSWQSEAGTIYGGSLDVTSGKLTVTHAIITLDGTETWTEHASGKYFAPVITNNSNLQSATGYLSNIYDFSGNGYSRSTDITTDNRFYLQGTYGRVWIYDSTIANLTALQTMLTNTPMVIVYPLATPQTYQLTPTQISAIVGTNNVFTDTNGDTSLEYYTKRGEQTVRIAEGVAVDVINNKSIDTLTTTDKTVKGAINELDGILDGIKAIETLFVTATIATSTTEYTTYNSRKFSDYDFYLFKIGASALDVRRTVILSKADWISGASINEVMLHGSTASTPSSYTASTFTAGYHSDTSFDANVSGSGSLNYLTIHGIRKN